MAHTNWHRFKTPPVTDERNAGLRSGSNLVDTDSRRIGVRRSAMPPQTKREYLRHLVAGKNAAFRPLTTEERSIGFLGWHERGYLPHCDYPGLVQFVTIRLEDSMPASRRGEWEHLLALDDVREKRLRLEEYLDRGIGECHLRDSRIAAVTEQAFLHHHLAAYEILSWVIMPNHAHVLVHVWHTPLWKMILSWKRFVATRALRMLRAMPQRRTPIRRVSDTFWQREYWDTYMRDAEQETKSVRYIESNPAKAHLVLDPGTWPFSSARLRDPRTGSWKSPPPPLERRTPIRREDERKRHWVGTSRIGVRRSGGRGIHTEAFSQCVGMNQFHRNFERVIGKADQ